MVAVANDGPENDQIISFSVNTAISQVPVDIGFHQACMSCSVDISPEFPSRQFMEDVSDFCERVINKSAKELGLSDPLRVEELRTATLETLSRVVGLSLDEFHSQIEEAYEVSLDELHYLDFATLLLELYYPELD